MMAVTGFKGLRIDIDLVTFGRTVKKSYIVPEMQNGPFTPKDLQKCFNEAKRLLSTCPCDHVEFAVKGRMGNITFGSPKRKQIERKTELLAFIKVKNIDNEKGVKKLRHHFLEREKLTPGFFREV